MRTRRHQYRLDERVGAYDRHVAQITREDERAVRLMCLNGVAATTGIVSVCHKPPMPTVRYAASVGAR